MPSNPNNARIEPPADMRTFAGRLFQMRTALLQSGFSRGESLTIVGQVIATSIDKAAGGGRDGKA